MPANSEKTIHTIGSFEFEVAACDCGIEKFEHPEGRGTDRHTIHLYPKDEVIRHFYRIGKGLINEKYRYKDNEKGALMDFLRIDDDASIKEFIEKHGFFLALDPTKEYEMDVKSLFVLINRLKATISLIMALSMHDKNYEKIMSLTLYLLLTPQVCFDYKNGSVPFSTCLHKAGEIWSDEERLEMNLKDIRFLDPRDDWEFVNDILKFMPDEAWDDSAFSEFSEDDFAYLNENNDSHDLSVYEHLKALQDDRISLPSSEHRKTGEAYISSAHIKYIPDSLYGKNISYNIEKYPHFCEQLKENPSSMWAKISILYLNCTQVDEYCRLALELIYAVCKEVSEVRSWNYDGKLVLKDNSKPVSDIFKEKLNRQMQTALLKLARHTLKMEMDYNLRETTPSYDAELMLPSWRIDNLLTGLYLTVFYTYPKIQVIRICENISCGLPFDVSASNSKDKYCSRSCANAMTQRRYRQSNKDKKTKQNSE